MAEKILVVSSDQKLVALVQKGLGLKGYSVTATEETGEKLGEILEQVQPGLIVLDAMMPRLDGLETCLWLRQLSPVPILMLSTWGAGKDQVRGIDLGAESYLTEPFDAAELVRRVEESLLRAAKGRAERKLTLA